MSDEVPTKNLDLALLKAQQAIVSVSKDATNSFHKYAYVSSESMMAECRAVLHQAGLVLTSEGAGTLSVLEHSVVWQPFKDSEPVMADTKTVIVKRSFRLTHPASGESKTYTLEFPAVPEKGRPIDKAVAGALTSSLSYFLRDLLQVPRGDENEMDRRQDEVVPPPPAQRKVADAPAKQPAKKQEQAPTDKVPTNRDKAIAKAKEWVDGMKEDVLPAVNLAVKHVLPNIKEGEKITNDADWKLIANFLEVAIAAKKWAGIKDYSETLKWLDIVKLSALPQHEGYELRDADVQAIKKQMDQSPFENEVPI